MKRKSREFDATKLHKEHVAWMKRGTNRKTMLDDRIAKLSEMIAASEHDIDSLHYLSCCVGDQPTWWINEFLDQVYRGVNCLESGSRMLDYKYYERRIAVALSDTPGAGRCHFQTDLYPLFLLLLAFRRWDQAMWLGGRIYGGREENARRAGDDKENGIPTWWECPLGGFVLRLYLAFAGCWTPGEVWEVGLPDAGPYAPIFDHWEDLPGLSAALFAACDYHVLRMEEDHRIPHDVAEFSMDPFHSLPVEALALRAVRERPGLETPFPAHPMLDSPFVRNLPRELPPCTDDLLLDAIAVTEKVLPGFLTDNPRHVIPGVVPIPPRKEYVPPPRAVGITRTEHFMPKDMAPLVMLVNTFYHIHSSAEISTCVEALLDQMALEQSSNGHRIRRMHIIVSGTREDVLAAHDLWMSAIGTRPTVCKWLLEDVLAFEMTFETKDRKTVRNHVYWTESAKRHHTEDGKRMSAEMKPADDD